MPQPSFLLLQAMEYEITTRFTPALVSLLRQAIDYAATTFFMPLLSFLLLQAMDYAITMATLGFLATALGQGLLQLYTKTRRTPGEGSRYEGVLTSELRLEVCANPHLIMLVECKQTTCDSCGD